MEPESTPGPILRELRDRLGANLAVLCLSQISRILAEGILHLRRSGLLVVVEVLLKRIVPEFRPMPHGAHRYGSLNAVRPDFVPVWFFPRGSQG
eukprot:scaffold5020_cov258-Pinguiococcus_pyrenoidosus.AAC.7